jgi:hypothetical protein
MRDYDYLTDPAPHDLDLELKRPRKSKKSGGVFGIIASSVAITAGVLTGNMISSGAVIANSDTTDGPQFDSAIAETTPTAKAKLKVRTITKVVTVTKVVKVKATAKAKAKPTATPPTFPTYSNASSSTPTGSGTGNVSSSTPTGSGSGNTTSATPSGGHGDDD